VHLTLPFLVAIHFISFELKLRSLIFVLKISAFSGTFSLTYILGAVFKLSVSFYEVTIVAKRKRKEFDVTTGHDLSNLKLWHATT